MKLNLIAISYQNIWPFKDQTVSLVFEKGNYLIKAPIWTGKSFLFFDWPTFALYKSSTRNILNIQSKTWFVKLLFSLDWENYFVIRNLKQWKVKDSISSHLYRCEVDEEKFFDEIWRWSPLRYDFDIEEELKKQRINLEEVVYKNETDLQSELISFLPPQEVFESTIFLLQDAKNIFEMAPADRLEVLKNVFWLLGIDESKEAVNEKKKEVKFKIKALQDTSGYEEKLERYLWNMIEEYNILKGNSISKEFVESSQWTIDELDNFKEKLSINNFSVDDSLFSFKTPLENKLQEIKNIYQEKRAKQSAYQDQKRGVESQLFSLQKDESENKLKLDQISKKLGEINPEILANLKEKKKKIQDEQELIESNAETEKCKSFYNENKDKLSLQERTTFSLRANDQFIKELIALGSSLKEKNNQIDQKIELFKKNQILEQENIKSQILNLEEKKSFYEKHYEELQLNITNFDKQVETEAEYSCWEIKAQCPFIKLINKQHFEQRDQEKQKLLKEKEQLENEIKSYDFQKKIEELKNKTLNPQNQQEEKNFQEEKKENEHAMEKIRTFLQSFEYKKIGENLLIYEKNEQEIKGLEKQIQEQETLQANKESYQQEKIKIETTLQQFQDQKKKLNEDIDQLNIQIASLQKELDQEPRNEILVVEKALSEYQQNLALLKALVEDYVKMQVALKWLLEEEKRLNVLYSILSKELLLFILESYLPVLTEIINTYLAQVVDYEISIKLKENTDKLELETKVLDSKGEREIKSLSWWQKTILKLVWMLAISSYMDTDMLFLDETVNNLDAWTVSRVAEMLDDFVKKKNMKFYTITHNSEIQSMKIWNAILEVKNNSLKD